jgi:hypothetical protein
MPAKAGIQINVIVKVMPAKAGITIKYGKNV